ncbi:NUDIX domain-containing protein [Aliiruegeria lutimaris]|uniref:ADP-ribose pyrophosphatase n=1 Tax=Aliiruegeria lutimaris TaxID=571298 RepID=A0A1G9DNT4_9RHOB|nr:NUDIX domain-containing protein [Aliiruegeria lutimaris]SDK65519.1 nudix-type nucleoside diphosphatase, YffH/AdpP family [Aliiruegeria lutimaris]
MEPIFLYGTLCHEPLRRLVVGEHAAPVAARLPDHAVYWARGESYPLIVSEAGAVAEGLLLRDPSDQAISRMDYYEGAFGYRLQAVDVLTEAGPERACIYAPPPTGMATAQPWDFDAWAERWGPLSCMTAEEVMMDMDRRTPREVARRFGPLQARAQARLNALNDTTPTTLRHNAGVDDIDLKRRSLAYANFFSVEEYDLTHRRFSGDHGAILNRTAFVSGDAITILPYDPVRDRVLLVEQFRAGPYARGDKQPWLLEAIAGRIDGGETPEQAALREAEEEAGLSVRDLRLVSQYYPTPGAKTEYLFGYLATADLPDEAAGLGGLEGEGEDIRTHVIGFDHAMELVESGEINVGPLILLLLYLARSRAELRAAAGLGG